MTRVQSNTHPIVRGRAFVATIGALVLIVTAVAATGAWAARKYYLERVSVRLNPIDVQRYWCRNQKLKPPAGERVVFIGDSRIVGWTPEPSLGSVELVWRGVPGETTAQMSYRFHSDALGIDSTSIVIQSGINDLVGGVAVGKADQVAHQTSRNLLQMASKGAASGRQVFLLTIVRPAQPPLWRRPFWSGSIYDQVTVVNNALRAVSLDGVHVIDADQLLAGSSRVLPNEYSSDTLHLTAQAYQALNRELVRVMDASRRVVQ